MSGKKWSLYKIYRKILIINFTFFHHFKSVCSVRQIFKRHQWCFQANSSCSWVSGWHFRTTTIYTLSHFWASGIWHGNVTISITESQYISLDVQEAGDALQGTYTEGDKEVKWAVSQALTAWHRPSSSFVFPLLPVFPVAKRRSLMFSSHLLIQAIAINSFLHLFCFLSTPPVTFEDGADVLPDGDAAAAVELAESQLHVEEGDTPEHGHQQVGQQKGTWAKDMRGEGIWERESEKKKVRREGKNLGIEVGRKSGKSERGITGRKKELWMSSKKPITLMRNAVCSHSICNLSCPLNNSQWTRTKNIKEHSVKIIKYCKYLIIYITPVHSKTTVHAVPVSYHSAFNTWKNTVRGSFCFNSAMTD